MDPILAQQIKHIKASLQGAAISCTDEKAINYGYQLTCSKGSESGRINVYHGKKGISIVVQGKAGAFKDTLTALAKRQGQGSTAQPTAIKQTRPVPKTASFTPTSTLLHPPGIPAWMGCDESGKGDVFGPLVAAACLIKADEEDQLRALGVCDSKLLTDKDIAVIARGIKKIVGNRCIVNILLPVVYNSRYNEYKRNHQNLNHLLGDTHSANIHSLLSKYECPCIIVDKFGKEEYVLRGLKKEVQTHTIVQVTKGERDTAVAAASILARQGFVEAMRDLSAAYSMFFPKGAYLGISDTIRRFRRQYGDEKLQFVGKLNFKNFDFLRK